METRDHAAARRHPPLLRRRHPPLLRRRHLPLLRRRHPPSVEAPVFPAKDPLRLRGPPTEERSGAAQAAYSTRFGPRWAPEEGHHGVGYARSPSRKLSIKRYTYIHMVDR